MALDVADPAYLRAVVAFAERAGCLDDLNDLLHWLDAFESQGPTHCVMHAAAPRYAMDFVIFEQHNATWRPSLVGRLTYTHPGGARAMPTFAVSFSTTRAPLSPRSAASP